MKPKTKTRTRRIDEAEEEKAGRILNKRTLARKKKLSPYERKFWKVEEHRRKLILSQDTLKRRLKLNEKP